LQTVKNQFCYLSKAHQALGLFSISVDQEEVFRWTHEEQDYNLIAIIYSP
jgi:hypothetical protein